MSIKAPTNVYKNSFWQKKYDNENILNPDCKRFYWEDTDFLESNSIQYNGEKIEKPEHVHKDFYKNELKMDDPVLFVDRISGGFIQGKISEFRKFAIGVTPDTFQNGISTYWRSEKEVVKTCLIK